MLQCLGLLQLSFMLSRRALAPGLETRSQDLKGKHFQLNFFMGSWVSTRRPLAEGTPKDIAANEAVQSAYLGKAA